MAARDRQEGGNHYKVLKIEVWDVIDAWGLGFYAGNTVKYIARYQVAQGETASGLPKGGLIDLKKARHYLDKLIEKEEENAKQKA